jgi:hypothetical protein
VLLQTLLWLCLTDAVASEQWQTVLETYRSSSGRVDYSAIRKNAGVDSCLQRMAAMPEPESKSERTAFWINAYNALTVDLVADNMPISSIRDLDNGRVWQSRRFTVGGKSVSLDQIEHQILRPLGEPRIHFALNCAAMGCPPLFEAAFDGSKLNDQLEQAARAWIPVNGVRIDRKGRQLHLSKLFEWYATDFVASPLSTIPNVEQSLQGVLQFLTRYVGEADASWIRDGGYSIMFFPYDWSINDASP